MLLKQDNYIENNELLCKPYSYGYTNEQAKSIFKIDSNQECYKNDIVSNISNSITINCNHGVGEYIIGGNKNNQVFG